MVVSSAALGPLSWITRGGSTTPEQSVIVVGATQAEAEASATNHGPRAVTRATVGVHCGASHIAIELGAIAPGQTVALVGHTGAGKTTMMDIITGKTRPDSGTVFFGSTINLLRHNEPEIAQMGIGRKFQKPTVFEQLSVFENLELALKTAKGVGASMRFTLNGEQKDRLIEVLQTIHLQNDVWRQAGQLSHGQKQWLEIGMLLVQEPKLLLLDEPVAGMTDQETERTAELFLSLKGKHSLMVVEHDMAFIRHIADVVTVLCDGSVLAQGSFDDVQANERVIEVYLGR